MAVAASARNLMVGTGTVSTTAASKVLTFSTAQSFKEGTTIIVDYAGTPQYFTIDVGAGTSWIAMQDAGSTVSGKAFKCTQTSTSRARGTDGVFVPRAAHFMYRSPVDQSGTPDWYFYVDAVFPEKGLHPYTKDQYTGNSAAAADAQQAVIPDLATRVRIIEGILRGNATPGHILDPDKRLDAIEARLNALDSGGNPTYTLQQMLDYGDA
jgi:hypothetical protein